MKRQARFPEAEKKSSLRARALILVVALLACLGALAAAAGLSFLIIKARTVGGIAPQGLKIFADRGKMWASQWPACRLRPCGGTGWP